MKENILVEKDNLLQSKRKDENWKKKELRKLSGFLYGSFYKNEVNYDDIIDIIKKDKAEKSHLDRIKISKYLKETDLIIKLKKEKINLSNIDQLMYFCSTYLEYQSLEKREILFREGDIGDKFYIIIKGSVNVLRSISNSEKLTGEQYVKRIIKLKSECIYNELIEKSVKKNNKVFYIDLNQIEYMDEIIFCLKVLKMLSNRYSIQEIDDFVFDYNINIEIYMTNYNILKKRPEEFYSQFRKKIYERLKELNIEINNYWYLESSETKQVSFFYYEKVLTMKKGDFFGDVALDIGCTRNATIEGNEGMTHLGFLKRSAYISFFAKEKHILGLQEMNFFIDNFFFHSISKETFKIKYFYDFVFVTMKKNEFVIEEKENLNQIYFCKEGEIELSFQMSLEELDNFIKFNSKKFDLNVAERNLDLTLASKRFQSEMKEKKNWRLYIYGKRKAYGIVEYVYKIPGICQAKVISEYAKFYRISYNIFSKLLDEELSCKNSLSNWAKKEFTAILKRCVDMRIIHYNLAKERYFTKLNMDLNSIKGVSLTKQPNPFLNNIISCEYNLDTTKLDLEKKAFSIERQRLNNRRTESTIFLTENTLISDRLSKKSMISTQLKTDQTTISKQKKKYIIKQKSSSFLPPHHRNYPLTERLEAKTNRIIGRMTTSVENFSNFFNIEEEPLPKSYINTESFGSIAIKNSLINPYVNNLRYNIEKKKVKRNNKNQINSKLNQCLSNPFSKTSERFTIDTDKIEIPIKAFPQFTNRLKINYLFKKIRICKEKDR